MDDGHDPLISIPAAARAIGLDRTTLGKQVRAGIVRSHDGKVRLSEVLEDRAAHIDLSRSKRRDGEIDVPELTTPSVRAPAVAGGQEPDGEGDDEDGVLVDGEVMTYADARALKETYIARLKGLELATKRGELAPVAAMVSWCERMFGVVRERLLAIPGKLSGELDDEQGERLTNELYEALEDLHAQGAAAEALGAARGGADDGDDGV